MREEDVILSQAVNPSVKKRGRFWSNIWFWWFTLTVFYLWGSFWSGLFTYQSGRIIKSLSFLIGLFVPFGFWNLFASFDDLGEPHPSYYFLGLSPAVIVFPVFIICMILAIRFGRRIGGGAIRILFNLGVLLLLTLFVDLVIWHQWSSWHLFWQHFTYLF